MTSLNRDKIISALSQRKESVTVFFMDIDRLSSVCQMALWNAPEAFDVDGFNYIVAAGMIKIMPIYTMDSAGARVYIEECRKQRDIIAGRCAESGAYKTVLAVHDLMARNIKYKDAGALSHTIVAPLTMKYGVCDGFAKTYKYILDALGIPCVVVDGKAYDPLTSRWEAHAWNLVEVNGEWRHVDVTFDTTLMERGVPARDYFGLTDQRILLDHAYDAERYDTR